MPDRSPPPMLDKPAHQRWRHKKRGSVYKRLGQALVQTSRPLTDMTQVEVYQGDDGMMWVRPTSEFFDGRFEAVDEAIHQRG